MRMTMVIVLLALMAGTNSQAGVLSPGLEAQMDRLEDHEILKVLVIMKDGPDVQSMDKSLHEQSASLAVRHRTVVGSLQNAALASQRDILADLNFRQADKSAGDVRGFTPHWIINCIVLLADVGTIRQIADRDDVDVVEMDLEVELIEPVMTKPALGLGPSSPQAGFLAPGVEMVNAPRVWHELGFDGTGTIVANMDSGVDGNHEILAARWRGNFAPASECWRDNAGLGYPDFPHDGHGHGTHTMGTITGAAGIDTIGVAPGALWIASNAISSQGTALERDNGIIAGFEFFADPDGDPNTTDDVPDVIQNSWGIPPSNITGYPACDSRWWEVIDNCEAAGVVVTWSAGNEGPTKGTIRIPADRASSPTNCFSIGSVGFDIPYVVSNFSSRGSSGCGGPHAIKPEVVAPGENILSSVPGNNYTYMSGTSMAGPHVAGIVALMRQANPDIDVTDVKQILMDTAIDVGQIGNDNNSGYGMVDAYAAVWAAMTDVATVQGTVTDNSTGLPLPGVLVQRSGFTGNLLTDAEGFYSLNLRSGSSLLEFSKFSFVPHDVLLNLEVGEIRTLDIDFEKLPVAMVSGTVFGPDGQPTEGASVYANGVPNEPYTTGSDGYYEIELPVSEEGSYEMVATALDLAYAVEFIGLPANRTVDFHLPYIVAEGFETGTMESFPWQSGGRMPMAVDLEEAYEGVFSARSGALGDDETSEMSIDFYVAGDGEFSFYVKVESEYGFDGLAFLVDGIQRASWSGDVDWEKFSIQVTAGQHNFEWIYFKDYAVSVMRDAAWIDRIEFPGTGVQPEPRVQIDQTNVTMALNPLSADSTALEVSNIGGYRLDYTVQLTPFAVNGPATAEDLEGKNTFELVEQGILGAPEKSSEVPWATVVPSSGWVHPGVSRDLMVTFTTGDMPHGSYYALLEFLSNDPTQTVITVPLIFTVGGVSDVDQTVAVPRVTLAGAVPNPFNPVTHVTYSLPADSEVSLRIYDVSGHLVRELVSGHRSAGDHRELWDGRDQAGLESASGVYFSRLSVGDQTEMKSMLLLR